MIDPFHAPVSAVGVCDDRDRGAAKRAQVIDER